MNIAIILSGGQGCRMDMDIPKQYIEVDGRPIIAWCLETFVKHRAIDALIIVLDPQWQTFVASLPVLSGPDKPIYYAHSGDTRQQSIYNGLKRAEECGTVDEDIVIIHDAARPSVSIRVIDDVLNACSGCDGAIAVLPVADTIYMSTDGLYLSGLLPRDMLFAGQTPEAFRFKKYLRVHETLPQEDWRTMKGGLEIAYRGGLIIKFVQGAESNFKLTVPDDLERFSRSLCP